MSATVTAAPPKEAAPPPRKLLKSAAVMARFGGISNQTLWRYTRDSDLGFPSPLYINGVRYWEESSINYLLAYWMYRDRHGDDPAPPLR